MQQAVSQSGKAHVVLLSLGIEACLSMREKTSQASTETQGQMFHLLHSGSDFDLRLLC